jgi:hypothetical protein
MQNKDHNECPFSDEIVSYMYGEMPDGAQLKFERHLSACQVCTDDFAAVSLARFEAYDWKRVDFDPLETPRIVIPYPEKAVSFGERISAWVSWVTIVPAAAVVVICLGIAFTVSRNSRGQVNAPVASVPQTGQPSSAPQNPGTRAPIVDPVNVGASNPKAVPVVVKKKPSIPKTLYARRVVPGLKLANDLAVNFTSDQVKRAPRLGMNDPEEDRSLRLADLFDETNPPPQR